MLRRLLILPPIIAGGLVLYFLASNRLEPERLPPTEEARLVRVIEATGTDLVPRVIGYGTVRPSKVWDAAAQVSGEIVFMHAGLKRGALLAQGTEILRISPLDYDLAIATAEANIRSAEARLRELEVSEANTRETLALERRALEIRETELERKQSLLAQGVVAQSVVDQETRDTLTQRQRVQEFENTLRLIPTQVAVQEEQKAVYEAELASARLDLERTRISLPFDARIAAVHVEDTQFVQVGTVMVEADGVETAEIEAQVPVGRFRMLAVAATGEELRGGISPDAIERLIESMGLSVIVRLRDADEVTEWTGRFARLSDTIDPKTRTVGVIAEVDGAYAMAVPGQRPPLAKGFFVELEIRARAIAGQIVVPRAALHGDALHVVGADSRLEIRAVETGMRQGDLVAISRGLAEGERVVVSDLIPAVEGMLLATEEDAALMQALGAEARGESALR